MLSRNLGCSEGSLKLAVTINSYLRDVETKLENSGDLTEVPQLLPGLGLAVKSCLSGCLPHFLEL